MTLATSCIVADPPEYTDPVQTRPSLNAYAANPPIYNVVVIQTTLPARPTFHVPVRSEDAGERLLANLWLDYGSTNPQFIQGSYVAPSTLDNTSDRFIDIPWTALSADKKGCHSISMIVAHDSSYTTPQVLDTKLGNRDAAIITWWVNVNPTADTLTNLLACPSPQVTVTLPAP